MTEKMKRGIRIVQTLAESVIVVCAPVLAAVMFSNKFYAFAAVCVVVAVLTQVAVRLRTGLRRSQEEKSCEDCQWLEHSHKGYYRCRRFDTGLSNSVIYYPSEGVCEYWEDKSEIRKPSRIEKYCGNCRRLKIIDSKIAVCSLDEESNRESLSRKTIQRLNACSCQFWNEDWPGRPRGGNTQ